MTSITGLPYVWEKLAATGFMFVLTLCCSYAPWLVRLRFKKSNAFMSYLNSLAGGVVLGALLMHMIPEIVSSHSHAHDHSHGHKPGHKKHGNKGPKHNHDHHSQFQVGPFCAGISFFVLFAIDRLFLTHSHCQEAQKDNQSTMLMEEKRSQHNPTPNTHVHHNHGHNHCQNDYKVGQEKSECCHATEQIIKSSNHDLESLHVHDTNFEPTESSEDDHGSCHSADLVGGCHMEGINSAATQAQTFIFVLALSIHSFFEGLGMATKDSKEDLILYLISLYAHKWLEAFALGVSILKANFKPVHVFFLIMFYSLLTPLGIFTGFGLELFAAQNKTFFTSEMTGQILNGLAVGSFLFVSCIEMIPPEFHKRTKHTPFKFIALVLGFVVMAALSMVH